MSYNKWQVFQKAKYAGQQAEEVYLENNYEEACRAYIQALEGLVEYINLEQYNQSKREEAKVLFNKYERRVKELKLKLGDYTVQQQELNTEGSSKDWKIASDPADTGRQKKYSQNEVNSQQTKANGTIKGNNINKNPEQQAPVNQQTPRPPQLESQSTTSSSSQQSQQTRERGLRYGGQGKPKVKDKKKKKDSYFACSTKDFANMSTKLDLEDFQVTQPRKRFSGTFLQYILRKGKTNQPLGISAVQIMEKDATVANNTNTTYNNNNKNKHQYTTSTQQSSSQQSSNNGAYKHGYTDGGEDSNTSYYSDLQKSSVFDDPRGKQYNSYEFSNGNGCAIDNNKGAYCEKAHGQSNQYTNGKVGVKTNGDYVKENSNGYSNGSYYGKNDDNNNQNNQSSNNNVNNKFRVDAENDGRSYMGQNNNIINPVEVLPQDNFCVIKKLTKIPKFRRSKYEDDDDVFLPASSILQGVAQRPEPNVINEPIRNHGRLISNLSIQDKHTIDKYTIDSSVSTFQDSLLIRRHASTFGSSSENRSILDSIDLSTSRCKDEIQSTIATLSFPESDLRDWPQYDNYPSQASRSSSMRQSLRSSTTMGRGGRSNNIGGRLTSFQVGQDYEYIKDLQKKMSQVKRLTQDDAQFSDLSAMSSILRNTSIGRNSFHDNPYFNNSLNYNFSIRSQSTLNNPLKAIQEQELEMEFESLQADTNSLQNIERQTSGVIIYAQELNVGLDSYNDLQYVLDTKQMSNELQSNQSIIKEPITSIYGIKRTNMTGSSIKKVSFSDNVVQTPESSETRLEPQQQQLKNNANSRQGGPVKQVLPPRQQPIQPSQDYNQISPSSQGVKDNFFDNFQTEISNHWAAYGNQSNIPKKSSKTETFMDANQATDHWAQFKQILENPSPIEPGKDQVSQQHSATQQDIGLQFSNTNNTNSHHDDSQVTLKQKKLQPQDLDGNGSISMKIHSPLDLSLAIDSGASKPVSKGASFFGDNSSEDSSNWFKDAYAVLKQDEPIKYEQPSNDQISSRVPLGQDSFGTPMSMTRDNSNFDAVLSQFPEGSFKQIKGAHTELKQDKDFEQTQYLIDPQKSEKVGNYKSPLGCPSPLDSMNDKIFQKPLDSNTNDISSRGKMGVNSSNQDSFNSNNNNMSATSLEKDKSIEAQKEGEESSSKVPLDTKQRQQRIDKKSGSDVLVYQNFQQPHGEVQSQVPETQIDNINAQNKQVPQAEQENSDNKQIDSISSSTSSRSSSMSNNVQKGINNQSYNDEKLVERKSKDLDINTPRSQFDNQRKSVGTSDSQRRLQQELISQNQFLVPKTEESSQELSGDIEDAVQDITSYLPDIGNVYQREDSKQYFFPRKMPPNTLGCLQQQSNDQRDTISSIQQFQFQPHLRYRCLSQPQNQNQTQIQSHPINQQHPFQAQLQSRSQSNIYPLHQPNNLAQSQANTQKQHNSNIETQPQIKIQTYSKPMTNHQSQLDTQNQSQLQDTPQLQYKLQSQPQLQQELIHIHIALDIEKQTGGAQNLGKHTSVDLNKINEENDMYVSKLRQLKNRGNQSDNYNQRLKGMLVENSQQDEACMTSEPISRTISFESAVKYGVPEISDQSDSQTIALNSIVQEISLKGIEEEDCQATQQGCHQAQKQASKDIDKGDLQEKYKNSLGLRGKENNQEEKGKNTWQGHGSKIKQLQSQKDTHAGPRGTEVNAFPTNQSLDPVQEQNLKVREEQGQDTEDLAETSKTIEAKLKCMKMNFQRFDSESSQEQQTILSPLTNNLPHKQVGSNVQISNSERPSKHPNSSIHTTTSRTQSQNLSTQTSANCSLQGNQETNNVLSSQQLQSQFHELVKDPPVPQVYSTVSANNVAQDQDQDQVAEASHNRSTQSAQTLQVIRHSKESFKEQLARDDDQFQKMYLSIVPNLSLQHQQDSMQISQQISSMLRPQFSQLVQEGNSQIQDLQAYTFQQKQDSIGSNTSSLYRQSRVDNSFRNFGYIYQQQQNEGLLQDKLPDEVQRLFKYQEGALDGDVGSRGVSLSDFDGEDEGTGGSSNLQEARSQGLIQQIQNQQQQEQVYWQQEQQQIQHELQLQQQQLQYQQLQQQSPQYKQYEKYQQQEEDLQINGDVTSGRAYLKTSEDSDGKGDLKEFNNSSGSSYGKHVDNGIINNSIKDKFNSIASNEYFNSANNNNNTNNSITNSSNNGQFTKKHQDNVSDQTVEFGKSTDIKNSGYQTSNGVTHFVKRQQSFNLAKQKSAQEYNLEQFSKFQDTASQTPIPRPTDSRNIDYLPLQVSKKIQIFGQQVSCEVEEFQNPLIQLIQQQKRLLDPLVGSVLQEIITDCLEVDRRLTDFSNKGYSSLSFQDLINKRAVKIVHQVHNCTEFMNKKCLQEVKDIIAYQLQDDYRKLLLVYGAEVEWRGFSLAQYISSQIKALYIEISIDRILELQEYQTLKSLDIILQEIKMMYIEKQQPFLVVFKNGGKVFEKQNQTQNHYRLFKAVLLQKWLEIKLKDSNQLQIMTIITLEQPIDPVQELQWVVDYPLYLNVMDFQSRLEYIKLQLDGTTHSLSGKQIEEIAHKTSNFTNKNVVDYIANVQNNQFSQFLFKFAKPLGYYIPVQPDVEGDKFTLEELQNKVKGITNRQGQWYKIDSNGQTQLYIQMPTITYNYFMQYLNESTNDSSQELASFEKFDQKITASINQNKR